MFPKDFEHDGEHQIAPMPSHTYYERHLRRAREATSALSPTAHTELKECWSAPVWNPFKCAFEPGNLFFNVRLAKRILRTRPRLPSFVDVDLLMGDPIVEPYLRTIYKHREDEWPWVNVNVPGILVFYKTEWILIDGNHRYARARRLGHPHFLAYVLTEDEAIETQQVDHDDFNDDL